MGRKLINYLPEVLRNYREFQKTFEAEEPEVKKVYNELSKVLDDLFVEDATERGVKRWENILRIVLKPSENLEDRKFKILSKLVKKLPYTRRRLEQLLEVLCGENGYLLEIVEGTTNMIPVEAQDFSGGWYAYRGSVVTLTQNISVPEWKTNKATRIDITGGAALSKYVYNINRDLDYLNNKAFVVHVRVKNIGINPVRVHSNRGESKVVLPGETKLVILYVEAKESSRHLQLIFGGTTIEDELSLIVYQPMAEQKPYATPFTEGTRPYNYTVKVRVALTRKNTFDDVKILLQEVVPANHIVDLSLLYNQHFTVGQYKHGELSTWTHDYIRNEVLNQ